jgi:CHAD domain-containing protein
LRLAALRDAVGLALKGRDDSFEIVHQLRVAARRASAALEIFKPCLSRKAHRRASKKVRQLRRAAGQARDLDVFLMHYTRRLETAAPEDAPTLDLLCGYAIAERIPAVAGLREACAGYPFEIERWTSATVAAVVRPRRKIRRMQVLASECLGRLFDRIQQAIGVSAPSDEDLHGVRLLAKRLRYAMEVFAGCYPAPLQDELYPRVVELQVILGDISDAHDRLARTESLLHGLSSLLPSQSGRWNKTLERLSEELKQMRLKGCEEFEAWKARADRTGFEELFHSLCDGATTDVPDGLIAVAQAS